MFGAMGYIHAHVQSQVILVTISRIYVQAFSTSHCPVECHSCDHLHTKQILIPLTKQDMGKL